VIGSLIALGIVGVLVVVALLSERYAQRSTASGGYTVIELATVGQVSGGA